MKGTELLAACNHQRLNVIGLILPFAYNRFSHDWARSTPEGSCAPCNCCVSLCLCPRVEARDKATEVRALSSKCIGRCHAERIRAEGVRMFARLCACILHIYIYMIYVRLC